MSTEPVCASRWWTCALMAVLIGVAVAAYANTFRAGFQFDDDPRIVSNPFVRVTDLSFRSLHDAAFRPPSLPNRPVANVTFALNYYLHRYRLPGYHLVNTGVHALAAVFMFLLLIETLTLDGAAARRSCALAFSAALLWVVHPLHTQTVTYIVQRQNGLAAMFFVCCMWHYVRGRKAAMNAPARRWVPAGWYSLAALAGLLALGSKPNAITLPVVIVLYDWFFFGNLERRWWRRNAIPVLLLAGITVVVALIYVGAQPLDRLQQFRDLEEKSFTPWQRALTQPRVIWHYLSLIVLPLPRRLNLDHDWLLSTSLVNPATTLPALCGLVLLAALTVWAAPRRRLAAFCVLWFLINLLVESSVIPLAVIFEHRTYLPSMFLMLLAVLPLRHCRSSQCCAGLTAVVLLASGFTWWTVTRNRVWADPLSLWEDTARKSPAKARVQVNYAAALHAAGRLEEARQAYRLALAIEPDHPEASTELARLLYAEGQTAAARDVLLKVVAGGRRTAKAHLLLAEVYQALNDPESALSHAAMAVRKDSRSHQAHLAFAELLIEQGRVQDAGVHVDLAARLYPELPAVRIAQARILRATGHYAKALETLEDLLNTAPDNAAIHMQYGVTLQQMGRTPEARRHLAQAVELDPESAAAHYNLALVLSSAGQRPEALNHYRRALEINPSYLEARNNLANVLLETGQFRNAIHHYETILAHVPDHVEAHNNLGAALLQIGRVDAAIDHLRTASRLAPEGDGSRSNLIQALDVQAELNRVRAELHQRVAEAPDDPARRIALAWHHHRRGDLGAAIGQYREALRIEPRYHDALQGLAAAHADGEQYDQAAAVLEQMRDLWPESGVIAYNLACMLARDARIEAALAALNDALAKGYANWELIGTDPDLDVLRDHAAFQHIIERFAPSGD